MITKEYLQKIRNELSAIDGPVMPHQLPKIRFDHKGLINYAKEHGKNVTDLEDEDIVRYLNQYDQQ